MSELEVRPLGRGRYLIVDGAGHRIAFAAADATSTWVHIDGEVFHVRRDAGRQEPSGTDAADTSLETPMPATVVSVHVQPGQAVVAGDLLVTLEAMKMELPVRAPRTGRIAGVGCRVGDLVRPGRPLVTLEDSGPSEDGALG